MADNTVAIDIEVQVGDLESRLSKIEASLGGIAENGKKVGDDVAGGFDAAEKGAKGASKGVKGLAGGFKTLAAATGFIFILTEAFAFLKELLMGNQKVADALSKVFTTVEIVFNNVFNAVSSLITELKKLSSFSLKDAFAAFTNFGSAVASAGDGALETADKLVTLRNQVKLAEAQQGLLMLQYQKDAELQRQIRDDVSLTIEKRQEANTKLGQILDQQAEKELELSNQRLQLALMEEEMNKDSIDAQVEVINARKEIADVNERITGQRSEQLTNENGLLQENIDKIKEQSAAKIEAAEAEAALLNKLAEDKIAAEESLESYLSERRALSRAEQIQSEVDLALKIEEDKEFAAIAAASRLGATAAELEEIRLAAIDESLRIENEIRGKYAAEDIKLAEETASALATVEKDKEDEVKKAEEAKQEYREAGLSAASSIVGSLGQLAGLMGKQSAESVALQKTMAIAQIAIDTATSISAAIAGATASAAGTGIAAVATTPVFIATQIATVLGALAQVGTIMASVPGPSAGGAISGASANIPASAPPSIDPVTTNTSELAGAQGAQLAPIQAFVVETEMTGNQQNISQIENQVTFGIDG